VIIRPGLMRHNNASSSMPYVLVGGAPGAKEVPIPRNLQPGVPVYTQRNTFEVVTPTLRYGVPRVVNNLPVALGVIGHRVRR